MLSDQPEHAGDDPLAAADRRSGGKRHQSVLLVGRVQRGGVDGACVVHDISQHGLMARFPEAPAVGDELVVEVRGLPPMRGTVRWVKGRKAGLQFAESQPIEQVFQLKRDDGLVSRPPRFALSGPVTLRLEGERVTAEAVDISAGGVKLATGEAVDAGQTGQVTLVDTGTALFGRICWAQGGQLGFRFCAPLPLDALSRILER
ncbi:PilZ domain-containing protein [Sphingomonas rubra]|uniref:PilZ domain-containing protein n=1 Tax=Sphingomonas rubra TaxID=634430 RepID=A0A1I5TXC3_9SPHN|nr:PilZ domain-containing protein [Sphingomonas rubra]SFP87257.1 PilZ domain-containing protein [Sphingomonas rubra]